MSHRKHSLPDSLLGIQRHFVSLGYSVTPKVKSDFLCPAHTLCLDDPSHSTSTWTHASQPWWCVWVPGPCIQLTICPAHCRLEEWMWESSKRATLFHRGFLWLCPPCLFTTERSEMSGVSKWSSCVKHTVLCVSWATTSPSFHWPIICQVLLISFTVSLEGLPLFSMVFPQHGWKQNELSSWVSGLNHP